MSACQLISQRYFAKVLAVLIIFVSLICLSILYIEDVRSYGKLAGETVHKLGSELVDTELSAFLRDNEERKQTIKTMCLKLADQGYLFEHSRHNDPIQFWITQEPKFLFCAIPKVGSSTWADVFLTYYNQSNQDSGQYTVYSLQQKFIPREEKMAEVAKMKYGLGERKRMMITRHPLGRLQSGYNDKIVPETVHEVFKVRHPNGTQIPEPTYQEFLYWIARQELLNMNEHFAPNSWKCNPCMYHYDYIIKMDTYERDSNAVIRKVNLLSNYTVQHNHNHESAKKLTNLSKPTNADTFKLLEGLDADTLSKLYTRYLPDFLLFGYDITPLEDMIRRKVQESA